MFSRCNLVACLVVVACATLASAQTDLTALVGKREFTNLELTRIRAWLDEMAGRYQRAADAKERGRVRDQLERLVDNPSATMEFMRVFGREFARAFQPFVRATDFETAFDIAVFLDRFEGSVTREALVAALFSPHAAARYRGADGLRRARNQLKKPEEFGPVIEALGQAGAAESDALILELIYEALDYDDAGFTGHDQTARALLAILEARLAAPGGSPRREIADRAGFAVAAKVYPKLQGDARTQRRLVLAVARYLTQLGQRYIQLGSPDGTSNLRDTVAACEEALAAMVRAAGTGQPPSEGQRVATRIGSGSDAKAVEQALAAWIGTANTPGVLNGDPWRLPIGLSE